MRRAKIVCTIGPSSQSEEALERMVLAGMNVARLNFSHGDHDTHRTVFNTIRALSLKHDRAIAILQDLQGPKIRVGRFEEGSIQLEEGQPFIITVDDCIGNSHRVSTTYAGLATDVDAGDILLLDDGLLRLRVVRVVDTDVHCICEIGGTLKDNKGINLPTAAVSTPSMTEKDKADLEFGLELGVDYIALSFVRSALDIHQLRALFPANLETRPKVIAKIEKPQAVENLKDIIAVADGIMVARGDLGVELPPQRVPVIQKQALDLANKVGRISITATQMLESMTDNPRPTRAEASDVANAILDGTDAVMLSAETATGKYPVETVRMMSAIIEEVEQSPIYRSVPTPTFIPHIQSFPNAVAKAAATAADELNIETIVVLTLSGFTARLMMTYRPTKRIIAGTPSRNVYQQMALFWGVEPLHVDNWAELGMYIQTEDGPINATVPHTTESVITALEDLLIKKCDISPNDEIIVVMGSPVSKRSETNLVKFHRISPHLP